MASGSVLWGADDFSREAAHACLAGLRVLVLGDSVTAGTYLDMCQLLGGGCESAWDTKAYAPPASLPRSAVAFAPVFGNFPVRHRGLANMVGGEQWCGSRHRPRIEHGTLTAVTVPRV